MNSQTVTQVQRAVQHPLSSANPTQELNPAAKRLLLSAHLSLVCKKLRRGLSVEEHEILELIPFTIPSGSPPANEAHDEISDELAGSLVDASDENWVRRLAGVGVLR